MINNIKLNDKQSQSSLAVVIILLLVFCLYFLSDSIFIIVPFALGLIPLVLLYGFKNPAFFCLIFYVFSVFRIQDLIPALLPLKIPFVAATLSILSLMLNVAMHKLKLFWQKEMTYLTLFFIHVSLGVVLSAELSMALDLWSSVFVKVIIIFFLIAWLLESSRDLKWFINVSIFWGVLFGLNILYNKFYGIGLIEGTRATIVFSSGQGFDPNNLSLILLIPFSFSFAMFFKQSTPILKIIGLCSAIIITSGIIATQSRGGILGIFGISIYFFSFRIKSKAPIAALGAGLFIFFYFIANLSERNTFEKHGLDESSSGRIFAWKAAINMAIHHPIFGVGLGGFVPNFYNYASGKGNTMITAHSSWFLVLAESGFIGLVLFITCIYLAIKATRLAIVRAEALDINNPKKAEYLIFSHGLMGCFIGFCISGSFLSQAFTWPIYILLAVSVALTHIIHNNLDYE